MAPYPHLFSAWQIRHTPIKNRVVFPPTCPSWVSDPWNGVFVDKQLMDPLWCMNDEVSAEELRRLIVARVHRLPEARHAAGTTLITLVMSQAFPCVSPAGAPQAL